MSAPKLAWRQFICRACGLIYDEALGDPDSGLAPGTRFEDIPDDWECPLCGVTKLDFEPYVKRERAPVCEAPVLPRQTGVVVVGGGLAGWSVVEAIRALDAQTPITLVSACRGDLYHKPELSLAISRGQPAETLVRERAIDAARRLGVRLLAETFAVGVSPDRYLLRTTRGNIPYSGLVLAQGARATLPAALPASECWRVNDLASWGGLQAQLTARPGQHVAIVGAGMIGCELAEDLARSGHQVTLIDRQSLPLSGFLPEQAATRLRDSLAALGVDYLPEACVTGLTSQPDGRRRITTDCGSTLLVDQVIAATGLVTEPRLARLAGLDFDRGIVVDPQTLQTSRPGIHALGDCISVLGQPCRFIEPIAQQAAVIAAQLVGGGEVLYQHAEPVIRLKTRALPIVLHGTPDAAAEWRVVSESRGLLRMEQWLGERRISTLAVGRDQAA